MADPDLKQKLIEHLSQPIDKYGEYPCLDDANLTPAERDKLTNMDIMVRTLIQKAGRGDLKTITEIIDRIWGKAQQHITAEVQHTTYVDFLGEIAENDPTALMDAEFSVEVEERPQDLPVIPSPISSIRGSSIVEKDVAEDLGLFYKDEDE